jgi:hypothetical protein
MDESQMRGARFLRRTFDRYNFDVGQIKVIFKKNLGQAGITVGNRVNGKPGTVHRQPEMASTLAGLTGRCRPASCVPDVDDNGGLRRMPRVW